MSFDDLPGIPILLREARGAYAHDIRDAISRAGLPSLPANGPLILGGLHNDPSLYEALVHHRKDSIEMNRTVERLFADGYLEGDRDAPTLTERGHQAAHLSHDAVVALTASLESRLGERGMESFIEGLLFLIEKKEHGESAHS